MIFQRGFNQISKERAIMKTQVVVLALIFSVLFFNLSCEVIGSEDDIEIQDVLFQLDSTYIHVDSLIAEGTVENNGEQSITPMWYIEGQFYADSSFVVKLGGDSQSFNFPLDVGQITHWKLVFTSNTIDVTDYPCFSLRELRAIYHPTS